MKNKRIKNLVEKTFIITILTILVFATSHRQVEAKQAEEQVKIAQVVEVKSEQPVKVVETKAQVVISPVIETKKAPIVTPKPVIKAKPAVVAKPKVEVVKYDSISKDEVKAYICEVFFFYFQNALIIAMHESGYNTNAISRTDDHGIFQIHCQLWCNYFHVSREQLRADPKLNIRLGKVIFDRSNAGKSYTDKKARWRAWYTNKYL